MISAKVTHCRRRRYRFTLPATAKCYVSILLSGERNFNKIVIVMDDAMKVKLFWEFMAWKENMRRVEDENSVWAFNKSFVVARKAFWTTTEPWRSYEWKENRWLDVNASAMQNKLQNSRVFDGDLFFSHVGSCEIVLPKQNKIRWWMRFDDVERFI
jgi:hypothetical protein